MNAVKKRDRVNNTVETKGSSINATSVSTMEGSTWIMLLLSLIPAI